MSTFENKDEAGAIPESAATKTPSLSGSLEGKVAIVTGGGRGLGRSMVLGLVRAGATVIATAARESRELEHVAAEAPPGAVAPMIADVTDAQNCVALVAETLRRFGRLDILVNNAGRGMKYVSENFMTAPTRFWETDPGTWRLIIDANVNGPFFMARAAAAPMIKAGWGRIINTSVSYLTMQRRGFSPYGPSKAALESETQIWAQELAGTGLTVNAILPGGGPDRHDPQIPIPRTRASSCSIPISLSHPCSISRAQPRTELPENASIRATGVGIYLSRKRVSSAHVKPASTQPRGDRRSRGARLACEAVVSRGTA